MDLAGQLRQDIPNFRAEHDISRTVMIWCGSTEIYIEPSPVHENLEAFEEGLKNNDPVITPSMIYAYAALSEKIPFANGAPNLTVDIPALIDLAKKIKSRLAVKILRPARP